ncbi:uncharacterized protein LOC143206634 [Rhynchophorus ferrugineus]|uniref:uncharacterized protein LOC143206634 n=1 Tax=Rhynchophorus ferrugineus TaxID=354439 RepID=UPI003FCCC435
MGGGRKFREARIPRYMKGEVSDMTRLYDLRTFNRHREKVFYAKALVDHHPPHMNPMIYLNGKKLREDAIRLRQIDIENKNLLRKINTINRLGGKVDSYNPNAYLRIDKWRAYNVSIKKIEEKNRNLYELINTAKSFYDRANFQNEWERDLNKIQHICRYPVCILERPSLDDELRQALSISYLVKNGKYLGRVIIELYYDHVPVTVQNFLELCKGEDLTYKNNLVHRIIRGQYMEMGDITQCNGRGGFSVYGKSFAEENHKLKHTKAGVLSMKRIGWAENNSQFCITFRKMEQLDYKNVVFGNIIKGNSVLMDIQYYGRKIGKPLEEIVISNCGEYTK